MHGAAVIGEIALEATLAGAQRDDRAHVFLRHEDDHLDDGFANFGDARLLGHARRVFDALDGTVGEHDLVDHGGRRGDEVHVVFALEPLLHDVHVQHAEEAAAKTKAQRLRDLGFELQRGIIELELFERVAQGVVLAGLDRIEAGKHRGLDFLEAGQRILCRRRDVGDGVPHLRVLQFLHAGDDEAHLPGRKGVARRGTRREHTQLVAVMRGIGGHHADAILHAQGAVDHAHEHHHADVVVEPRVDDQRLQRGVGIALGRRDAGDDGIDDLVQPQPRLGAGRNGLAGVDADHVLDLGPGIVRVGRGQVHLVQHGHDLDAEVDGGVAVGHRLRLHTLRGIDHQQRPLAGRERTADLVGEVDVSRGVDEVKLVDGTVGRLVQQRRRLRLDGDAALAFQVHRIEHLAVHFTVGQAAQAVDQPVGQRGFAMVDVGNDGKVANVLHAGDK